MLLIIYDASCCHHSCSHDMIWQSKKDFYWMYHKCRHRKACDCCLDHLKWIVHFEMYYICWLVMVAFGYPCSSQTDFDNLKREKMNWITKCTICFEIAWTHCCNDKMSHKLFFDRSTGNNSVYNPTAYICNKTVFPLMYRFHMLTYDNNLTKKKTEEFQPVFFIKMPSQTYILQFQLFDRPFTNAHWILCYRWLLQPALYRLESIWNLRHWKKIKLIFTEFSA